MKPQNKQNTMEGGHGRWLLAIGVVLTVSGFASWLSSAFSVAIQWLVLQHALVGVLGAVLFVPYLVWHARRTLGMRRPLMTLSGLALALSSMALIVSGLQIAVSGRREALDWIVSLHIALAVMVVLVLMIHVISHLWHAEHGKWQQPTSPSSWAKQGQKTLLIALLASVSSVGVATALYGLRDDPYDDSAAIKPYVLPYGEHPFRPSQSETSSGGFLDARRLGESSRCAGCHADIARQWQASIHAQAASDKAYRTNVELLAERRGMAATRYCEGCHAPAALLSGQLSPGGRLDTPGHLREGVSCMSCHGIARIEHLQGVASYRIEPPQPYLFEGSRQAAAVFVHDWLLRLKPDRHKADLARPVLASPELCATCHAQFMDREVNDWGWVKMQDDYQSWLNGPYSGQYRQPFAHATRQRCQDCHFPLQAGDDPSANASGLLKSHFNLGANTAIPWVNQNHAQLQRTIDFLRADRVRLSIDRPNRADATESQRPMAPHLMPSTEAPAYVHLGETVTLEVVVSNAQVGHAFPGGTTDLNEAWLHVLVTDSQGMTVHESGAMDSSQEVDAKAHFYRSIAIDRAGDEVWRHDLFNMVGDSFKRVIPPGGSDVAHYTFNVPDEVKGPLHVSARLLYRKLNPRYARWALKDDTIELPVVEMATASLVLPVKIQPEILLAPNVLH